MLKMAAKLLLLIASKVSVAKCTTPVLKNLELISLYRILEWIRLVWDFYGHPSILDDTKSLNLTRNVWWNYRTLLQKLNIPLS